jgi:hypothetical protein
MVKTASRDRAISEDWGLSFSGLPSRRATRFEPVADAGVFDEIDMLRCGCYYI